jgi:hypothetical protein
MLNILEFGNGYMIFDANWEFIDCKLKMEGE